MDAPTETKIERLLTPSEWLKFVRNGAGFALCVGAILFWRSPHPADQIVVTIAVPLIIFNCIPFVLLGMGAAVSAIAVKLFPEPQQQLPLHPQKIDTLAVPLKYRLLAYTFIGALLVFFAGIAVLLASCTYNFFAVHWAVRPARLLAYIMLAPSLLAVIFAIGFIVGVYYSSNFRNSGSIYWVSRKATRPSTYWPTAA